MTLAAGDFSGQIIFLIIAALTWVIGEIARKRREGAEGSGPVEDEDEVGTSRPPRRRPRVILEDVLGLPPTDEPVPTPPPPPPPPRRRPQPEPELQPSLALVPEVPLAERPMPPPVHVAAAHRTRAPVRDRLGLTKGVPIRAATRRAILWAEVLGPPRALRGPHRPPALERRPR